MFYPVPRVDDSEPTLLAVTALLVGALFVGLFFF